jgi:hypothetical protein
MQTVLQRLKPCTSRAPPRKSVSAHDLIVAPVVDTSSIKRILPLPRRVYTLLALSRLDQVPGLVHEFAGKKIARRDRYGYPLAPLAGSGRQAGSVAPAACSVWLRGGPLPHVAAVEPPYYVIIISVEPRRYLGRHMRTFEITPL